MPREGFGALHQRGHKQLVQAAHGHFVHAGCRLPETVGLPVPSRKELPDRLPGVHAEPVMPDRVEGVAVFVHLGQQVERAPAPGHFRQGFEQVGQGRMVDAVQGQEEGDARRAFPGDIGDLPDQGG